MLTEIYVYQDKNRLLHFVWESADVRDCSEDDDMTFIGTFVGEVYHDKQMSEKYIMINRL